MQQETMATEDICQNTRCPYGRPRIVAIRGHRRRQYCCDTCKHAVFAARRLEAQQIQAEQEKQAEEIRALDALRKHYDGDLLPDTLEVLYAFSQRYGSSLVDTIAKTIQAERQDAVLSEHHRRIFMIDDILCSGEKLGFCQVDTDEVHIAPGDDAWIVFVNSASMPALRSMVSTVAVLLRRAAARQRLAERC